MDTYAARQQLQVLGGHSYSGTTTDGIYYYDNHTIGSFASKHHYTMALGTTYFRYMV